MEILIEDSLIRQLEELYAIEKQCFKEEAFSKQQIAYLLTDYNSISLTAKYAGKVAGFIIGQIEAEGSTLVGHIITIDVLPAYRRKGVAQKFLQKTEALFRGRGIRECRLEVRVDNEAALALYGKLGYEKVAHLEHYYRTAHGWCLRKLL